MRLIPQDYLNFYMQPIYVRRQLGSLWINWVLLGLGLILLCGIGFLSKQWPVAIAIGGSISGGFLIIMWWIYFIGSVLQQNSPRNACLTPRLRQRLIQATVLLWAIFSAAFAAIAACGAGHFALIFELTGLMLIFFTTVHIPWFILSFVTVSVVLTNTTHALDSARFQQFALSNIGLIVGAALILVLGTYAIQRIFQRGSNRHWKEYKRLRLGLGAFGGDAKRKDSSRNALGERRFPILPNRYFSFFKPEKLSNATPIQRALLALGPGFYGRGIVGPAACIMLAVVVGCSLEHWQLIHVSASLQMIVKWFVFAYCVLPLFLYVQQVISSIYRTRREQALIRLTPATPEASKFNDLLYPALLKRFLLAWSALCFCGLISFMLLDGSTINALPLLSLCPVYLLLAPSILQNYATMKSPENSSMLVGALLSLHALILGFAGLRYWVYPLPWPVLGVFSVVITIIMVVLRVRRMNKAPAAYPAGRFA